MVAARDDKPNRRPDASFGNESDADKMELETERHALFGAGQVASEGKAASVR
jgi:hypothetical protein